jgi:hypothetical protein
MMRALRAGLLCLAVGGAGLFLAPAGAHAVVVTDEYDAGAFLTSLHIFAAVPLADSVLAHNTGKGGFGDAQVLSFIRFGEDEFPGWGAAVIEVGGGNCPGPECLSFAKHGSKGAFYFGEAAEIFAIHWGGGGKNQPLLLLRFVEAITTFKITGFERGVSFIRAYNISEVPLPGALWLMGSVLAAWLGLGRWHRRQA